MARVWTSEAALRLRRGVRARGGGGCPPGHSGTPAASQGVSRRSLPAPLAPMPGIGTVLQTATTPPGHHLPLPPHPPAGCPRSTAPPIPSVALSFAGRYVTLSSWQTATAGGVSGNRRGYRHDRVRSERQQSCPLGGVYKDRTVLDVAGRTAQRYPGRPPPADGIRVGLEGKLIAEVSSGTNNAASNIRKCGTLASGSVFLLAD
jgi:hypothetical protein